MLSSASVDDLGRSRRAGQAETEDGLLIIGETCLPRLSSLSQPGIGPQDKPSDLILLSFDLQAAQSNFVVARLIVLVVFLDLPSAIPPSPLEHARVARASALADRSADAKEAVRLSISFGTVASLLELMLLSETSEAVSGAHRLAQHPDPSSIIEAALVGRGVLGSKDGKRSGMLVRGGGRGDVDE
jgi:hypothetical protein